MMIEDLMVIPTRKLPKFLRYDEINNKKAKKHNLFNKRQLKKIINLLYESTIMNRGENLNQTHR